MKLDIQKFAIQPANINVASNLTLGNSTIITLSPHTNDNRYVITLRIGEAYIIYTDNLRSNTYTLSTSLNLAHYITNNSHITATIICETYNLNKSIGITTKSIELYVPENSDTKPNISISSIQEGNSTMTSLNWGVYVQNHSQLKVNFSSSGKYNATIKKINITADGKTYSYDYNDASINTNKTTDIITTSGSKTITVEAIDSRGYTNSTTSSAITINAYSNPKITLVDVERTGTNNDQLKYTFKGSITNVGNNAHTFKMAYKLRSASAWSGETTVYNSGYTCNLENQTMNGWTLSGDNTYDIRFIATDSFTTSTQVLELSSEGELINFNTNGKAMAIGKVSEAVGNNELLEIAMPTKLIEGDYNSHCINGNSTGKWMKIMHLEIIQQYLDMPIVFNLLARSNQWARVYIRFASASNKDPNLISLTYECSSGCIFAPYIVRTSTSNWDLYVYGRAYETIEITQLEYTERHYNRVNITYPNDLIDTLPSGGISANEESYSKLEVDTIRTKNLFNYYDAPVSVSQVRVSFSGTAGIKVTSTGTGTFSLARYKIMDITNHKNKKVTLSAQISVNNGQPRMAIGTCDENGGNLNALATVDATTDGRYSVSAIMPSSITSTNKYLYVGFYVSHGTASSSGNNSNYTQIQLNFGDDITYYPYIDFDTNNFTKSKIIQMGTTSGAVFDTGISTHRLVAGIVIVLHSNDTPVIETFGRRYYDGSGQGNFTTSNSNLIKENTTTRTITLTSQNTSSDRCIIFYI